MTRPRSGGRFQRAESRFRNWVTPDGRPGPTGEGGFAAEPGRYHLYIARACPWAHRTTIFRALKGLDEAIGLSVTHWLMAEQGWTFAPAEGVIPDTVNGVRFLHELYTLADPHCSGRATVPVLWDKQRARSSATNRPTSSACSTPPSTASARRPGDYYPRAAAPRRSMR